MIRHSREIKRVLWLALLMNVLVALAKAIYGLMTGTLSLIADAIHSTTDAASSVMGLISVHFASRPSDEDHHYGHHKFETLAAMGIGAFIALTSWEILKSSIHRLATPHEPIFRSTGIWII